MNADELTQFSYVRVSQTLFENAFADCFLTVSVHILAHKQCISIQVFKNR